MERFARGSRGRGFPITNSHSTWYNILGQVTSVTAGGTLNVDPNGAFSTGGILMLDSGSSIIGGSVRAAAFQLNDGAVSASLSGTGALTKNTNGTVTLSGSNSYAGGTVINGGTLIVANSGAIPLGTNLSISAGGMGELASGSNPVIGGIDGTGSLRIDSGSDLTANHITMNALVIGGSSGAQAMVTIAPSDAAGNPLTSAAVGGTIHVAELPRGLSAPTGIALSMGVEASAPQGMAINIRPTAADRYGDMLLSRVPIIGGGRATLASLNWGDSLATADIAPDAESGAISQDSHTGLIESDELRLLDAVFTLNFP
jgi:autotransporter-associated beta strand protein